MGASQSRRGVDLPFERLVYVEGDHCEVLARGLQGYEGCSGGMLGLALLLVLLLSSSSGGRAERGSGEEAQGLVAGLVDEQS